MQWLLDQGARVLWGKFDSTKVPDEPAWHELVKHIEPIDLVLSAADKTGMEHGKLIVRQNAWWKAYRRMHDEIVAKVPIDFVVVAYANSMDKVAGMRGSPFRKTPWSAMSMRDSFHHQKMGVQTPRRRQDWAAEKLLRRIIRSPELVSWLTLDPTLEAWAIKNLGADGKKVVTYPDIGEVPENLAGQAAARENLGLASRPTISVVGSMELRKGVADAVACMAELPEFQLLLAGRFQPDCKELIDQPAARQLMDEGRLIVIDRRISVDELQWAMEAADVVWAVYQGHYFPSNIMTQAACFGRPLLGTTDGLIGDRIRVKKIGEVADTGDIPGQVEAIKTIVSRPEAYHDHLRAYADSQSAKVFAESMARAFLPRFGR